MAQSQSFTVMRRGALVAIALAGLAASAGFSRAEDKLLEETVEFTGTFIYLGAKPPAFVIGAIRNGETVVRGFGEIADGSGKAPDGDTLIAHWVDHQGLLRRDARQHGRRRQGQTHR